MKNKSTHNRKARHAYGVSLLLLSALLLTACGPNTKVKFSYEHPERYSVGDAVISQPVNAISISWYDGVVDIRYSDSNVFRISEESDSAITDSLRMRYYVDEDGELDIHFCQSGDYRHRQLYNPNKRLRVEVPHDANLDEIEINMVGGLISIDSVHSHELNLNVVNVATTVWSPTPADEIELDAVNATLRLYVPSTTGMTIEMNGITTTFDSELPVRKENKTTVIGDGRCKVDIDAVSSELYINKLNNQ